MRLKFNKKQIIAISIIILIGCFSIYKHYKFINEHDAELFGHWKDQCASKLRDGAACFVWVERKFYPDGTYTYEAADNNNERLIAESGEWSTHDQFLRMRIMEHSKMVKTYAKGEWVMHYSIKAKFNQFNVSPDQTSSIPLLVFDSIRFEGIDEKGYSEGSHEVPPQLPMILLGRLEK